MMRFPLLASALICFFPLPLQAELPPIKPEVWDVKEEDTKGCGAIILERSIKFHALKVEHAYLIRVMNEQGRNAVEFQKFPANSSIEGRTVRKDGTETPFKAVADFQAKALVETEKIALNSISVTPPGLSANCVVQIQWSEPASFSMLPRGWDYVRTVDRIFSLATRVPTRRLEVEVFDDLAWAYDLQTGPRGAIIKNEKGFRRATFTDLPAYEWVPYSEESAKDNPRFVLYQQPEFLMREAALGQSAYWKKVANTQYRPFYERKFQFGKSWGGFSEEMRQGLPTSRQEAAVELQRRLSARILNLNDLTFEEKAARTEKQNNWKLDPADFSEALKKGETSHSGITLLYWVLLDAANIPAKPVLMVDRRVRRLRLKQCNYAQLEDWFLMIEEEGRSPIFIDPGRRFVPPDLLQTKYQGTEALAMLPGDPDWTYKTVQIPVQDGSRNTKVVKVNLQVGGDKDRIRMESTSTGAQEWGERVQWWSMLPADRNRNLKESLERKDPAVQIERASVSAFKSAPFRWTCEGTREREVSRHLEVRPFLLLDSPLPLPDDLPAKRNERIVLPQLGLWEYQATLTCPDGYSWPVADPIQASNAFGEVSWTINPGTSSSEFQVVFKVRVTTLLAEPVTYPEFKKFLGWVREGFNRTITLSKSSS